MAEESDFENMEKKSDSENIEEKPDIVDFYEYVDSIVETENTRKFNIEGVLANIWYNTSEADCDLAYDGLRYLYDPWHPQLASKEDIFDIAQEEDDDYLYDEEDDYEYYHGDIGKEYAACSNEILATLEYISQFDSNAEYSDKFFSVLSELISNNPQITEGALQLMQKYPLNDFSVLDKALKKRPDLVENIYEIAVNNGVNDDFMQSDLLKNIINIAPKYTDIALDEYINRKRRELEHLTATDVSHVSTLFDIYRTLPLHKAGNPEKLLRFYEQTMKHPLNAKATLGEALGYLRKLYHYYPNQTESIFRLYNLAIDTVFEEDYFIDTVRILDDLFDENAAVIPQVFAAAENFEKRLNKHYIDDHDESMYHMFMLDLNDVYEKIMEMEPSYIPQIFKLIEKRLQIGYAEQSGCKKLLNFIASKYSDHEDRALAIYQKICRTDPRRVVTPILEALIDGDKHWLKKLLDEDDLHLGSPDNFEIANPVFGNFEHNWDKVFPAIAAHEAGDYWRTFYNTDEIYPGYDFALKKFAYIGHYEQMADKAFEMIKTGITKYHAVNGSCFEFLAGYAEKNPQRLREILDLYKEGMKCDHDSKYNVRKALVSFLKIIDNDCAKYEKDFVEVHQIAWQSGQKNALFDTMNSLSDLDYTGAIPQQIDLIRQAIAANPNNEPAQRSAITICSSILRKNPKFSAPILDIFKNILDSCQEPTTLEQAFSKLGTIAKIRPELIGDILKIMGEAKNYPTTLYYIVETIVDKHPQAAGQVLDMVSRIKNLNDYDKRMLTYKTCIRHLPLSETLAAYPEIAQELQAAYNGRFASKEEFEYALSIFKISDLAKSDSRIFHNQQADFTMLLEREAALHDIPGKEICRYRHTDATERVQDFYYEQEPWITPASFKTSRLFARKAQSKINANAVSLSSFLDKAKKCGLSPHDAVDILPDPAKDPATNAQLTGLIHRNLERITKNKNNLNDLRLIINNWNTVEQYIADPDKHEKIYRINDKGFMTDKLDYKKVLKLCQSIKYTNQRSKIFATEAADIRNGLSQRQYRHAEDIYLAGLKVPEPFDSSRVFTAGGYTARFLPREDPRVMFFGNYTDCCQHYDGFGHECAVSTVKHPFSQLFVVENKRGEIIAGSWTWENTEGKYREVCFDNIEIKGDYSEDNLQYLSQNEDYTIYEVNSCVDHIGYSKIVSLFQEYNKALQKTGSDSAAPEDTENLKSLSHQIDNELQSKEIREHEMGESLISLWTEHKSAQQQFKTAYETYKSIISLYEQSADYLAKDANCRRVTIGKGRQDVDISHYKETKAVPLPKLYGDGYTDAYSQVMLVDNPKAKPLDKSQESQRYIRDVCYLDIPEMERVCSKVFPDGDKELERPDNDEDLAGLVIEDREKGVVGYCLYEKIGEDAYYISDTAVLPEYRSDKNASSKKLFAEMMRCVRKKDGTWYANMREETSLRYLKAMAARGLAEYKILSDEEAHNLGLEGMRQMEYDSKLGVASKVFPVRFELTDKARNESQRQDVQEAAVRAHGKLTSTAEKKAVPTRQNHAPAHFTTRINNDAENTA